MLVPRYERFTAVDAAWDEDECGPGILAAVIVACAPVALKYYLDHRAEARRIAHAQQHPEMYGIDDGEDDE